MSIFKRMYIRKLSSTQIASELDRAILTITRELKSGSEQDGYNPLLAEYYHLQQRQHQVQHLKIDKNVWCKIKPKLELRWSPDEIANWLKSAEK